MPGHPFIAIEEGASRERVLTVAELAQLWDAEMPDHLRTFIAIMVGTGARPDAVLELARFQCDIDRGMIDLNPPGRRQAKKRRPKIPMAAWLLPFIESADGHVVSWRGRPVTKIAGAFQTVRESAGFGMDVTAYDFWGGLPPDPEA